jgi:hypothetical protein
MKDARGGGLGTLKIDTLIHYALVFFIGMALGAAITFFGFEGSFTDYRKAEFKGQKLEVTNYLRLLENEKLSDAEVRENLRSTLRNKVKYYNDMEQHVVD